MSSKSSLQKPTAQSTLESELIVMANSAKEGMYYECYRSSDSKINGISLFGNNTGALHVVQLHLQREDQKHRSHIRFLKGIG